MQPPDNINVCHMISGDLWAGAECQFYHLARAFSGSQQVNLSVISFNEGILSFKLRQSGINADIIDERKLNIFQSIRGIMRILRHNKIDILHTHGYKETFLGKIAASISNVKAVLRTHHGKGVLEGTFKHRCIEKLNGRFFTDYNVSVSDDLLNYLEKIEQFKNIITIHNRIDPNSIIVRKKPCLVKSELGIPDDIPLIGTVGRLVPIKGYSHFIEGAKRVLDSGHMAFFVIVGEGAMMNDLQLEVNNTGCHEYIKLIGFQKDIYEIINAFDLFVMTSLHEGIPMVLLEAMCLGRPVIATNVGGIPEVITNEKDGILIPPCDPEAFSVACSRLINEEDFRLQLSVNAKATISERYDIRASVEQLEKLYLGIL